ncbi:MAG: hypothetical protein QTN59_13650 [Candidatus Electrothrix communis]|nr:hypothetical protein [Desulfobulbus sp. US4]WLE95719.1 MAG: hypothetical protein QTN59_13650 [Candidatus Electrothrix communis]
MLEMFFFHSGNPVLVSYRKVTDVVEAMQEKFGDQLDLKIYKTDSEMARAFGCRGSTAVFVNRKMVAPEVATSKEKMENYLNEILSS